MSMKCLITGGAGMVGSHLTKRLLKLGHHVTVLDNFSNGRRGNLPEIEKGLKIMNGDVARGFEVQGYETIFHLACHPRTMSFDNELADMRVNYLSTLRMLPTLRELGCKIIFSSNSGIYPSGDGVKLPIDETCPDGRPKTPYDAHKLASEKAIQCYHDAYNIPATIFRFATVYGSHQALSEGWRPVISEFTTKALQGRELTINGTGNQTRDFIHVSDVVDALVKAMKINTPVEPIILSTDTETDIIELAAMIMGLTNSNSHIAYGPQPLGDPKRMRYSNKKALQILGWSPKVSLKQGLAVDVIPYWRERLKDLGQG